MGEDNIHKQPKFIVFLSQLPVLFKFCSFCKGNYLHVETTHFVTMAIMKSLCRNTACQEELLWKSQPLMLGTKIPAGNSCLSFAILVAGS